MIVTGRQVGRSPLIIAVQVQRFRSIEEMNASPILTAPWSAFHRFSAALRPLPDHRSRTYPRSVFEFRTIDEAQAARQRVTLTSDF